MAATVGVVSVGLLTAASSAPAMPIWEYHVERHGGSPDKFVDTLSGMNDLGAGGWELVAVTDYESAKWYLFQRPKR